MIELTSEFDAELWRWSLRAPAGTVGPAGTATACLGESAWVHVDESSGGIVEITLDAANGAGRLDASTEEVFLALDRRAAGPADGLRLADEVANQLARLAVLCETRAERALLGPVSGWWDAEARALFRTLGIEPPAGGPGDATAGLDLPAIELVGDLRSGGWIDRIEEVVTAGSVGRLREALPPVSAADLRELADPATARLGLLPESGSGRVAVDPSLVPVGRLDLRTGVMVNVDRPRSSLSVSVPVQRGVYAADVQGILVILLDEAEDVPVAVSPLALSIGDRADAMEAGVDLIVGAQRDLTSLSLQLTSQTGALPSSGLRGRRRALTAARHDLTLDRLAAPPGPTLWESGAFLGELADAAALTQT
ncbi:MAG: hypothetical protein U0Q22_15070 [Acidimicrobiales bacterium]